MIDLLKCFECESCENIVYHHVIPRSLGGKKTLPLCQICHDKVHRYKKHRNISISNLTKQGLIRARQRGVKLGNPNLKVARIVARKARKIAAKNFAEKLRPVFEELKKTSINSLRGYAKYLNQQGFKTAQGKLFAPQTVKNILKFLEK